jgi:hypothetical protein
MAWFKSIEDIHNRLLQKSKKLALQIDVTATPKNIAVKFLYKPFLIILWLKPYIKAW